MAPIIDIIRHAESEHNIYPNGSYIVDPGLTPGGEDQASSLGRFYANNNKDNPIMNNVTHIISSPMRRCIRTAQIAFEPLLNDGDVSGSGKKILLLAELQETGVMPSDRGSSVAALREEFAPQVDTSRLDGDWYLKTQSSRYRPDVSLVEERAREARVFIRSLARRQAASHISKRRDGKDRDARIVVMTHGGFAHFLTGDYSGLNEDYFTSYGNASVRSFRFVDLDGDDDEAGMVMTEESCDRQRGEHGIHSFETLGGEEKTRLRGFAVRRVEAQKTLFEEMTKPDRGEVRTHVF